MTSDLTNSPNSSREPLDIGPLSWVMAEVREAIGNAGKMLRDAVAQDAETRLTTLLHAKSYLHQVNGALQIVDIDGVALVTETIEDLIERFHTAQLELNQARVDVIVDAFHAVLRYLEDLLSGAAHQPVRLFPYYRALLEIKGAERIHPADLFFPALSAQEQIPELAVGGRVAPVAYPALRSRFEKLLLTVLTGKDKAQQRAAVKLMHDLIGEIEKGQGSSQTKAFWVVMRAFAEAVAAGEIDIAQYVKQIFGRINLQIRRLVEGGTSIPERLLRDALFFLAQVEHRSPFVGRVCSAYQLDNQVPLDYDQKRYGQVAANVLASAKEQLSAVKNLWGRIANGDAGLADKFSQKIKDLAETGTGLNAPALSKLLRELSGIARHVAHTPDAGRLGLELATCLLFVENALDQIDRLPAHFSERAGEMTARLLSLVSGDEPAAPAAWMGEISREAQQRQTLAVLVIEMQASLRQAEKILDEYFRDPAGKEPLKQVDDVLHQIGGAMAILDQDSAMQAVEHARAMIRAFPDVTQEQPFDSSAPVYQNVAQNIGALSFFIETLQSQPDNARKKFAFDAEAGVFRSNLLEKAVGKELLPQGDIRAETGAAEGSAAPITSEQELLNQQHESARLAASLADSPDDLELQSQLKDSLESVRSVATLLDDSAAGERAKAAIDMLGRADFSATSGELQHIVAAAEPAKAEQMPTHAPVLPADDEAIDAELLEIFLTEADEVLAFVRENIPLSRQEPDRQEYLTSLRRSFHTLKGSSRMVGLTVFGEAAWNIEQVMNLWLSESRPGTEHLYALLEHAAAELYDWVEELNQSGQSPRNGSALIGAAQLVKAGLPYAVPPELTAAAAEPMETAPQQAAAEALVQPEQPEQLGAVPAESLVPEAPATAVAEETAAALSLSDWDEPVAALPVLEEAVPALPEEPAVEQVVEAAAELTAESLPEPELALELMPELVFEPVVDELPLPEPVSEPLPELILEPLAEVVAETVADELPLPTAAEEVPPLAQELSETPVVAEAVAVEAELEDSSVAELPELEAPLEMAAASVPAEVAPALAGGAQIIEFPGMAQTAPLADDNVKRIGDIEIALPLHTIYMAETDEIVRFLVQDFAEWRHEAYRPVATQAIHAAHRLAGTSATVGLKAVQELAHSLEMVLQRLERHPVNLLAADFDTLDHVLEVMRRMLQKFALSEMAEADHVENLRLEQLLQDVIERSHSGPDEEEPGAVGAPEAGVADEALVAAEMPAEATPVEAAPLEQSPAYEATVVEEPVAAEPVAEEPVVAEPVAEEPAVEVLAAVEAYQPAPADLAETALETGSEPGLQVRDDLDADLLPVFIEEGHDLLPMVGQLLRSWHDQPGDTAIPQSIARLMHTIKGSARMAGAMELGQHIHDMEARIESILHGGGMVRAALLDDLLSRHDHSMHLFERLQHPAAAPAAVADSALTAAQELDQFQESLAAQASVPQPAATVPAVLAPANDAAPRPALRPAPVHPAVAATLVRVRADILDRLVNQAGEVSISRSRLENEIDTLRSSLTELTENVSRLRDQLREVEIQAETQISSHMVHAADREFDPLEFDRFTRLQELTRMMAESVSDVAAVQTNLTRTIDGASDDLHMQARLTRELQQDLMRVRMIPFASISERLYRVTRQTAKELDKRVNLDIRGATVEMDRGVLEKMAGPFEHLLRNAIVHGIEDREQRRALGKSETGELLVEIRQEGNEVVIRFKDDGQGLHLDRIRDKARTIGLLTGDEEVSEADTANLIFEPGFSTASEVTELAGRGVGMDVVRSEAASLGGRVEVITAPGQGAEFTIHLPLTLAVTQVVLLSAGGRTFAVPSVLVEQVQQLKAAALANAYNDGGIMWQGQKVVLHYLSALLGQHDAVPLAQQYTPLVIMKSGTERVALHVDDIVGNREVVVKNIGPQLARMTGIAGATVLGSGEIVLILNPVPLAHRVQHEHARAPQAAAQQELGAVADLAHAHDGATAEPVQGLRTQHTVMVVDDSLTVRRVTQRLLTREGYQVILAKDGIDALEQLQSVTPDVMLVDIEMPRMDGFDLTRNVRGDARTAHIPIIMITSRTADKHRNYARELGVNEYFGKPYREDDLLESIVHFVGKAVVEA